MFSVEEVFFKQTSIYWIKTSHFFNRLKSFAAHLFRSGSWFTIAPSLPRNKKWKKFHRIKIFHRFLEKFNFFLNFEFCFEPCPIRETAMDAKKLSDFKRNKFKLDQTSSCFLSMRRNSWPSVAVETTLRHTTSGIFDPIDDDDDDIVDVKNVEFIPSKSPCCNGRTFDFATRTNNFRTNVISTNTLRPFWGPTLLNVRQNAVDVCDDSGQMSIEEEELLKRPNEGKPNPIL